MRFKLILFFVNNIKIEILESSQLMDIDLLTTKYKNSAELIRASRNIINDYFNRIVDIDSFLGTAGDKSLKVCFVDQGGYYKEISPLYKGNCRKLNPSSILNGIVKKLKDDIDYTVTVQFLNKFMYMFNSQFNIERNKIYDLKNSLSINSIDGNILNMQQKNFDKILKIIKDDLRISSSDIEKKQFRYVNLRVIDDYFNNASFLAKKTILTSNSQMTNHIYLTSNNQKSSKDVLFCHFIDELLKESDFEYTTMGEVAYLFDEYLKDYSEKVRVKK